MGAGLQEAFDRVARTATRLLGVPVALVTRVGSERQVFLGASGLDGDVGETRETPLSHSFCQHVVAGARPLVVADAREDDLLRDNLAIRDLGVIAYAGFPIYDGADPVGAFCAIDTQPHAWTDGELELVRDLTALAQSQLDLQAGTRAAQHERAGAEAATEVLRRLTAVMDAARGAEGLDTLLEGVVAAAAEALEAPAAMVVLSDEDGGLRVRASVGVSEALREQALPPGGVAASVLASGRVESISDLGAAAIDDGLLDAEGMRAAIGAPLRVGGRAPGVILIADREPRDWSEFELQLVRLAADRLGVSFERARATDEERDVAERLQRALEPTRLPRHPHVRLAARYRPAERRIGGDWYDAFELPGGCIGLAIGDVVGHGIVAAAAAVRLRHFLRGFVLQGLAPGQALAELNLLVDDEPDAAYSSVVYAELDPGAQTLRWASAGHLPPVLVRAGVATPLESDGGSLLGAMPLDPWPERTIELAAGDRVILYTDGLVERPGVPIDDDILSTFGAVAGECDLQRLCHRLVASRPAPDRDDVAVLAAAID
jgi:GAF domain-containing protein